MRELRFTLVADGSSDRALLPIFIWLLREHFGRIPIQPEFADLRRLPNPPRELFERIAKSVELYPCDLLFVHRDAEREPIESRVAEIREALGRCALDKRPVVCVVPVRMQEAWLLIDECALRKAAGNPRGRQRLDIPEPKKLEDLPDPKQILHDLLREASGFRGRRLKGFIRDVGSHVHRVAEQIDDFSVLRELTAFRRVECQVVALRKNDILPVPHPDAQDGDLHEVFN